MPPVVSGEGHTVPERVGPRGADNATNRVLVCLPCAQVVKSAWAPPSTKKNPSKNKRKEILKLSRSQMRRLIELITGQNNLNYMQTKINPGLISEMCRFCEEEETFAHLLNECPCFNTHRRDIINNNLIINTIK